jgi:hypothetical protein
MSQDVYFLVLCPGTFDTSSGPLLPRLDQASYSCAGTGEVSEGCIFSGGEVNIQVEDPGIEGYSINAINFLGITFTGFTGYSIELLGSAPTEAIFMNCLWQDFSADGIARILNENNPPMDLELEMCSIQSSTGDPEDAILDVAFENNGGAMLLGSVLVEAIQVDVSFLLLFQVLRHLRQRILNSMVFLFFENDRTRLLTHSKMEHQWFLNPHFGATRLRG